MANVIGKIHSIESFGTVDGPGVRFVVFTQGCPLRCLYCHNPDTWNANKANILMSAQELFEETLKYKPYFEKRGGVTCSGGEPLLQGEFIKEYFKLCKNENIHTAIDTCGYFLNETVKSALQYTDLVLLDIKTINKELHQHLTGVKRDNSLRFLEYLQEINKSTWIRHVVVPTLTYKETDLEALAEYLKHFSVIEKVELLPYHTAGIVKYEALNIKYPIKDILPLSDTQLEKAKEIFKQKGLKVN